MKLIHPDPNRATHGIHAGGGSLPSSRDLRTVRPGKQRNAVETMSPYTLEDFPITEAPRI